jgi:hypothetical protein
MLGVAATLSLASAAAANQQGMLSPGWDVHTQAKPQYTALAATEYSAPFASEFTLYSPPVDLRYGEVYSTDFSFFYSPDHNLLPLPEDVVARYADGSRRMAIRSYRADLVRKLDGGSEERVPLNQAYVHHAKWLLGSLPDMLSMLDYNVQKSAPGIGPDYRGTDDSLHAPFRRVHQHPPQVWMPIMHIINTRKPMVQWDGSLSPLTQCPCAPERVIDVVNGTVDGEPPDPEFYECLPELAAQGNPSCTLSTLREAGGSRCCRNGMSLLDPSAECTTPLCTEYPRERFFMKVVVEYEDESASTRNAVLVGHTPACGSNTEYYVPQCEPSTKASECVMEVSSVSPFFVRSNVTSFYDGRDNVAFETMAMAAAVPHLHSTAISLELQDAETNVTLCMASKANGGVRYGTGGEVGNERSYLVGMSWCKFDNDTAPLIRNGQPLRTIAVYNASKTSRAVMAGWALYVASHAP